MDRSADLGDLDVALTRIGRAANSRRAAQRRAERAGTALTTAAVATLSAVYRHGPIRARSVAEVAELEPSRVSREVRSLVEAGFVEQRADADDRRAVLLVVTPQGKRAFERYRRAADELLDELMASWSDRDLHTLSSLLKRLADEIS